MVAQTRKIKADCGVEPGASSPPPAIAQAELYRATLDRIEANDWDVFKGKTRLSTGEKLAVVAKGLVR